MGGTLTVQVGVMLRRQYIGRERLVGTGRGVVIVWCTLLGPEGPGFPARCGRGLSRMGLPVMVGSCCGSSSGPCDAGAVVLVEDGADRMLRTTQWTRASLDSRHR